VTNKSGGVDPEDYYSLVVLPGKGDGTFGPPTGWPGR